MEPNQNANNVRKPAGTTIGGIPVSASARRPVNAVRPVGAARPATAARTASATRTASAARPVAAARPLSTASDVNDLSNEPSALSIPEKASEDVVFRDKPKRKTAVVLAIVLLVLLAAGGIGFGVWAMMDGNSQKNSYEEQISTLKKQNDELQEQLSNNTMKNNDLSDDSVEKCEGVYYGEASGTLPNGLAYDYKYTYTLNKDGTFTADFGGLSGEGMYVINDNTISLIGQKHTVGPKDEDPYYITKDYVISDDCSSIKVVDGEVKFVLNKQ